MLPLFIVESLLEFDFLGEFRFLETTPPVDEALLPVKLDDDVFLLLVWLELHLSISLPFPLLECELLSLVELFVTIFFSSMRAPCSLTDS